MSILRRWRSDCLIAGALLLAGCSVGAIECVGYGQGFFYQADYGAAVSVACGHGFSDSAEHSVQEQQFLGDNTFSGSKFSCQHLSDPGTAPPSSLAQQTPYLMLSVAYLWKLLGISWSAMIPLIAFFVGLSWLGTYVICRFLVKHVLSAVLTIGIGLSAVQISMITEFRDFAKVPFILAGLIAGGVMVCRFHSLRRSLLIGGIAGIVTGVGFGFRPDALVVVPFFVATTILFLPGRFSLAKAMRIVGSLTAFGASCLLVASPILAGSGDNNDSVFISEGLSTPFVVALGLQNNYYDFGYTYNDTYAVDLVNAQARLLDGYRQGSFLSSAPAMAEYSKQYNDAAVATAPADELTRIYAAALQVVLMRNAAAYVDIQPQITNSPLREAAHVASLLDPASHWPLSGIFLVAVALMMLAYRSLRLGLFAAFTILYFGGVTGLQYDIRHSFDLELVHYLAAALVLETLAHWIRTAWVRRPSSWRGLRRSFEMTSQYRNGLLRVVAAAAVCVLPSATLLFGARYVQEHRMRSLLMAYATAPRTPLALAIEHGPSVGVTSALLSASAESIWQPNSATGVRLLVAMFSAANCPTAQIFPVFHYAASDSYSNLSFVRDIQFTQKAPTVSVYFLALRTGYSSLEKHGSQYSTFDGIRLPDPESGCLKSISVLHPTKAIHVIVDAQLPSNWRSLPLYLQFDGIDTPSAAFDGVYELSTVARQ